MVRAKAITIALALSLFKLADAAPPKAKTSESYRFTSAAMHKIAVKYQAHVRFGSKADMCRAQAHVRFTPESDIKCDIWSVR
jgi:hypothetical protein